MGQDNSLVTVVARLLLTNNGLHLHTISAGREPGPLHHPLMPGVGHIASLKGRYIDPGPSGQLLAELTRCQPEAIKWRIDPGRVDQSERTGQETVLVGSCARHSWMGWVGCAID